MTSFSTLLLPFCCLRSCGKADDPLGKVVSDERGRGSTELVFV